MIEAELKAVVENIENCIDVQKDAALDTKHAYEHASAKGFDTKVLKAVIARRAKERAALEEFDGLIATYEAAL